jgi:negative regulator of flagellin synthesis FlgM
MKIGHTADKPALAPSVTSPTSSPAGDASKAVAAGPKVDDSAKVALSNTAAALLSGQSTADFDAAKVERMSKAIADGTFQVNAEVIADKLIANAQELLGKSPR